MNRIILAAAIGLTALAIPATTQAGPPEKVTVCHVNGNGDVNAISISEAAFPSHLDHGDSAPGDPAPTSAPQGAVFGDNCEVIVNPEPDRFILDQLTRIITKCLDTDTGLWSAQVLVVAGGSGWDINSAGATPGVFWEVGTFQTVLPTFEFNSPFAYSYFKDGVLVGFGLPPVDSAASPCPV